MDSVAREDDMLAVNVRVSYPEWMDELNDDEFENVIKSARDKAVCAFAQEVYRAEEYWRARKMAASFGQMEIFECLNRNG